MSTETKRFIRDGEQGGRGYQGGGEGGGDYIPIATLAKDNKYYFIYSELAKQQFWVKVCILRLMP